jgi:hypothetical protein
VSRAGLQRQNELFPLQQQQLQQEIAAGQANLQNLPQRLQLENQDLQSQIDQRTAQTAAVDPQTQLQTKLDLIKAETDAQVELSNRTGATDLNIAQADARRQGALAEFLQATANANGVQDLDPTKASNIATDIHNRAKAQAIIEIGRKFGPEGLVTNPDGSIGVNFKHADAARVMAEQVDKTVRAQAQVLNDPLVLSFTSALLTGNESASAPAPAPAPVPTPVQTGQATQGADGFTYIPVPGEPGSYYRKDDPTKQKFQIGG